MKVKVCGMRNPENVSEVASLSIDFMGFIFYPKSKRFVGEDFDVNIIKSLPNTIKPVGVFVNESIVNVIGTEKKYSLAYLQIHGDESVEYCKELQTKTNASIVKAFQISDSFDFEMLKRYEPYCDYFLFDTKSDSYGGSGQKFEWIILQKYTLNLPFFLSGGIGVDDAESIKSVNHPKLYAIDLNSKFEIDSAFKSFKNLEFFLQNVSK